MRVIITAIVRILPAMEATGRTRASTQWETRSTSVARVATALMAAHLQNVSTIRGTRELIGPTNHQSANVSQNTSLAAVEKYFLLKFQGDRAD